MHRGLRFPANASHGVERENRNETHTREKESETTSTVVAALSRRAREACIQVCPYRAPEAAITGVRNEWMDAKGGAGCTRDVKTQKKERKKY